MSIIVIVTSIPHYLLFTIACINPTTKKAREAGATSMPMNTGMKFCMETDHLSLFIWWMGELQGFSKKRLTNVFQALLCGECYGNICT
jgi:hypothetical protein